MASKSTGTLAVLIDGDNASPKIVAGLLAEIANYGTASVKRVYGDWTKPNLNGWKQALLEYSLQPVQQFAYTSGKNATDGAMIIDAMDLLYSARFSGFCIVSSDSDFARLAARLREQGMTVYGFGERKTPRPFITACDKFVYFDVLPEPATQQPAELQADTGAARTIKPGLDGDVIKMLRAAVEASAGEDGRANLGQVGNYLSKQSPDFDPRNYGYARLSTMAEESGILNVERAGDRPIVVSLKSSHK